MHHDVRLLEPEEWRSWKELRLEGLAECPSSFSADLSIEEKAPDENFVQRMKANAIFGAWRAGRLVGTVGLSQRSDEKVRHKATMWGMYVRKEARGQGLGRALIDALTQQAQGRVVQIHCQVTTTNTAALKLYQSAGFEIYGTEPQALRVDGVFYDEYLMLLRV